MRNGNFEVVRGNDIESTITLKMIATRIVAKILMIVS